jgi:hypothetical protein
MNNIRQRHGIPDARKVNYIIPETQWVSVTDGVENEVLLLTGTATHPAGLSPEQARWIAHQLVASAARIETRFKGAKKEKQP